MIVGGYSLHLYCDHENQHGRDDYGEYGQFPHEFDEASKTAATKAARKAGWIVRHATAEGEGRAVCPSCKKRGLK